MIIIAPWALEFAGAADTSPDSLVWNFDTGGNWGGGQESQTYTARPENVSLDGAGHLRVSALRETFTGTDSVTRDYTSARIHTSNKLNIGYGRVEISMQVPTETGVLPQIWMVGQDGDTVGWPQSGEIDISEIPGIAIDPLSATRNSMNIHSPRIVDNTLDAALGGSYVYPADLDTGFHTYGIEWHADAIEFLFDGAIVMTITPVDVANAGGVWVFNKPNFFIINLAVGTPWTGQPDSSSTFPARILIDWIRYTTTPRKASRLVDPFDRLNPVWALSGTVTPSIDTGRLKLVGATGPLDYSRVTSDTGDPLDLTESEVFVAPSFGVAQASSEIALIFNDTANVNNYLALITSGGGLISRSRAAGVNSDVTITYDAVAHAYWRIRETGGNVIWETNPSRNPGTWTVQRTLATPAWVTSSYIILDAGHWDVTVADTVVYFDNLNVPPPASNRMKRWL